VRRFVDYLEISKMSKIVSTFSASENHHSKEGQNILPKCHCNARK